MTTLFGTLLVLHVVTGMLGVASSFTAALSLMSQTLDLAKVRCAALWAFVLYLTSWFTGGWYYWKYYGSVVKPTIMAGKYTWAHSIFTESKEHVFLFLPVAAIALYCILRWMGDDMMTNPALKRYTGALAVLITVVGVIVTLSGVLITGGAR